jgi:uracil-DNA glycosylase
MVGFDPGPPPEVAEHFARLPSFADHRDWFWYDWGPVFYRGRLDGSARLLGIASDPGPTERIAGRTLVGDAGQRVQGFLSKLGLTHSYALLNAFAYALLPSHADDALPLLAEQTHLAWRNALFAKVTGPALQAIVAFGVNAHRAVDLWDTKPAVPVVKVPHPSSRNEDRLLAAWADAVTQLRAVVTPDPDGDAAVPNYGSTFEESDYARIPLGDLPFGVPDWFGDDSWGRLAQPRHNNSVERPGSDLRHTLIWRAPHDRA